ncbi:MAG: hypothetical protein ABIA47_00325 [bacterium]
MGKRRIVRPASTSGFKMRLGDLTAEDERLLDPYADDHEEHPDDLFHEFDPDLTANSQENLFSEFRDVFEAYVDYERDRRRQTLDAYLTPEAGEDVLDMTLRLANSVSGPDLAVFLSCCVAVDLGEGFRVKPNNANVSAFLNALAGLAVGKALLAELHDILAMARNTKLSIYR